MVYHSSRVPLPENLQHWSWFWRLVVDQHLTKTHFMLVFTFTCRPSVFVKGNPIQMSVTVARRLETKMLPCLVAFHCCVEDRQMNRLQRARWKKQLKQPWKRPLKVPIIPGPVPPWITDKFHSTLNSNAHWLSRITTCCNRRPRSTASPSLRQK